MSEISFKGCPLLVQSDTHPSLTMRGESHTRSYFLPCLGQKCAAYEWGPNGGDCHHFGTKVRYRTPDATPPMKEAET